MATRPVTGSIIIWRRGRKRNEGCRLFRIRHVQSPSGSDGGRDWCCRPRRCSAGCTTATVVGHVGSHEMARGQCRAQTQFSSEHCSSHNPCQLTGVVTGVRGVRPAHSKQVKHGRLSFKDSTTTNSSDFNGRHRDSDLEVTIKTSSS